MMVDDLSVYLPIDRRAALLRDATLPDRAHGAVMFADVTGFTPLAESLAQALGSRRGAEELTALLNQVYSALVTQIEQFGGSVIGFSGDAITCWFDENMRLVASDLRLEETSNQTASLKPLTSGAALRALAAALAMQRAMTAFAAIPTPSGATAGLMVKVAIAAGPIRRFLIGDPQIQVLEVLAGRTLDRLAAAAHLAEHDDVVVDTATLDQIESPLSVASWRIETETQQRAAVIAELPLAVAQAPWPAILADRLPDDQVRPWVLPAVYARVRHSADPFLAELRPVVALMLQFGGLNYDSDESAGAKLDAYIRQVQAIVTRYEGHLVDVTMADKGGYLFAAFGALHAHEDDARRAALAALELRLLRVTPESEAARIGISQGMMRTGPYGGATRRAYGVLGDEVNLACRLMSAAAPGQILAKAQVQHLLTGTFQWAALPAIRVKGKRAPVAVYQVLAEAPAPPVVPEHGRATTPLIGRAAEYAVLTGALAAVGAAGWGELDSEQAVFPILAARVADVLRFTFSGPEASHVQLGQYLREKQLLLILDNCEHLPVTDFVVELLEQAPTLTVLVTSRGRLNVRGEYVVELEGLPFPSRRKVAELTDLNNYSAVQMFRHSAQSVNPRLDWTSATTAAAARVCELVAGLPLGIELAASLVRLMPCEEIAHEIEVNLNFLQSVRRDLPERHQNLQAVFDHSWKLLNAAEQRVLQQLAVYRGGFDREAAARVAGTTLPLLAALVDNSLVRRAAVQNQAAGRYELQELVRQYATDKLVAQSAHHEQLAVLDRHCHHYLNFLAQRKADLRGRRQAEALSEINLEIENIRGAWRWALAEGHIELISQASDSLFYFYETRGWFQEGAEVFAMAAGRISDLDLQHPRRETGIARGKLLAHQGWCAFQVGRQAEARGLLEQSQWILRSLEAQAELVLPLNYLAAAAYYSGDYAEADQLAEEALRLSLACGDQHGAAVAKTILGQIAYLVGRYEDARRHSQESIAIERELGNRWGMVFALISLGRVDQALGEYEEARRSFQEGLAIREMLGDARGIALCLDHLGDTEEALGNYSTARQYAM